MKSILITSSILILLIAVLRPSLRGRINPYIQYALWLVVALRLLVPVTLATSAYSAMALLERAEEPVQLVEAIGQIALPAQSYDSAHAQVVEEYRQQGTPTAALTPSDLMEIETQARALMKGPTLAQIAAKCATPVWLGGAVAIGVWFLLMNLRLRRKLSWAERLHMEGEAKLPVFVSDALPSPCLYGTFRPAIYVTPAAAEDPERMRHVLAHELSHYQHKDHWWALVRCLCLCLYWFDPLVWWAAAMSRQDCELACDAAAIRRMGEAERISYGRTLVAMIAEGRSSLLQTATTMTGSKRRVQERVRLIARGPRTVIALTLATLLLVGCAVGCTFTSAPGNAGTPSAPPLDGLVERLLDVPEELRDNVEARSEEGGDTLVVYYFKRPGQEVIESQYLLIVSETSEEDFQRSFYAGRIHSVGNRWFAKRGDRCYYLSWNTGIEYEEEDAEQFTAAFQAVLEFTKQTVLATEGMESFDPNDSLSQAEKEVQAVVEELMQASSLNLTLTAGAQSYSYSTSLVQDAYAGYLTGLYTLFRWEEAPYSTSVGADLLRISTGEGGGTSLFLSEGSYLMVTGDGSCYKGQRISEESDDTPFAYLKLWFDSLNARGLRPTTVLDRGQSLEETAREWAENWEGAMTKVESSNSYACTYVQVQNVTTDWQEYFPDWEGLASFVQNRNFAVQAEDYGKLWFIFSYNTVFVPVDQGLNSPFWAGNTEYYMGDDAPEGALVYSRVGCIWLTDEGWTCLGVGTSL